MAKKDTLIVSKECELLIHNYFLKPYFFIFFLKLLFIMKKVSKETKPKAEKKATPKKTVAKKTAKAKKA
jgi:hypothetical protein